MLFINMEAQDYDSWSSSLADLGHGVVDLLQDLLD